MSRGEAGSVAADDGLIPDETTEEEHVRPAMAEAGPRGLRLVIVWHRRPERIGKVAWVRWDHMGDALAVSRSEPLFDDGAPLGDPGVSRSPLHLVRSHSGMEVWSDAPTSAFDLDGRPGRPGASIPIERLRAGVLLGVGRGALLHVQLAQPPRPRGVPSLVGVSRDLERLSANLVEVARAAGAVLIRGESGTGKELVAEALHALGPRAGGPFVAVNVAALPPQLAAAQLFGHVRGAYTGADRASAGYFAQASGGTLFLDEIGAGPPEVQALLLRALDRQEIQVVGGSTRRVDVRVIAATDADLELALSAGTFRAPRFHRLAHHTLTIPPLRARPVDIPVQAVSFVREALEACGAEWPLGDGGVPWLGRGVVEVLLGAEWPGNSRELKAVMARLVGRYRFEASCGHPETAEPAADSVAVGLPDAGREPGTPDVLAALEACDFRLEAAAERIGISRNALKRRMAREGIRRPVDFSRSELAAALADAGSLRDAARALRISEHGLRIRLGEVELRSPEDAPLARSAASGAPMPSPESVPDRSAIGPETRAPEAPGVAHPANLPAASPSGADDRQHGPGGDRS